MQPNFTPFPILTTERLVLRDVNESDVNEILFLRSDERVMKYIDRPRAKSADEALAFIRMLNTASSNNESITWAMSLKDNPTLIGTICFWNVQKEHYRAEIGYAMHPQHYGKGLMTEAMQAILQYGFNTMKLHSVEANVNPDNNASIRVLERNGFVREAYFRENYFYDGKFLDSAIYSLIVS